MYKTLNRRDITTRLPSIQNTKKERRAQKYNSTHCGTLHGNYEKAKPNYDILVHHIPPISVTEAQEAQYADLDAQFEGILRRARIRELRRLKDSINQIYNRLLVQRELDYARLAVAGVPDDQIVLTIGERVRNSLYNIGINPASVGYHPVTGNPIARHTAVDATIPVARPSPQFPEYAGLVPTGGMLNRQAFDRVAEVGPRSDIARRIRDATSRIQRQGEIYDDITGEPPVDRDDTAPFVAEDTIVEGLVADTGQVDAPASEEIQQEIDLLEQVDMRETARAQELRETHTRYVENEFASAEPAEEGTYYGDQPPVTMPPDGFDTWAEWVHASVESVVDEYGRVEVASVRRVIDALPVEQRNDARNELSNWAISEQEFIGVGEDIGSYVRQRHNRFNLPRSAPQRETAIADVSSVLGGPPLDLGSLTEEGGARAPLSVPWARL